MERDYQWTLPEQSGQGAELWEDVLQRASAQPPAAKAAASALLPDDAKRMEDGPPRKEGREASRETNPASTYAPGQRGPRLIAKHGGAPWVPDERRYDPGCAGLHQEILDFVHWCRPTPHEFSVRMEVFKSLEALIHGLWPQAKVDFFGSFRTGLFLPTSDIDMVVMGEWEGYPLWTLEAALRDSGLTVAHSIKVLDKASVPIVKLQHAPTNLHVDISFNMVNGVPSAQLISEYMEAFPVLPYLVYVLKYFLLERDLNEVFTGGLSSYSLILMSISFLQLHAARRLQGQHPEERRTNLAVLLLEFLELYGRHFNYVSTAIRLRPQPSYTPKEELQREMPDGHRPSMLSIQDPLQPTNDIGRSCYGAMRVRQAFEWAFLTLTRALIHPAPHFSDHPSGSLLTRILRVTDAVVDYRAFLRTLPVGEALLSPAGTELPKEGGAEEAEEVAYAEAAVSYASVVSSQLPAVRRGARSSKRSSAKEGKGENGVPPAPRRQRGVSTSSELSSSSESESRSESSDGSGNSRRSYSSVASSNVPRAKVGRGPGSTSSAASSLAMRPPSRSRPPKPPSPAPSSDSAQGSTGHRNNYRRDRRRHQPLSHSAPNPAGPSHSHSAHSRKAPSPRRGGKKSS